MQETINKVVIVGGGTAGWLTAGVLASRYPSLDEGGISVALIESPDIATIGVGEGTWPSMRTTLQKMGISETDFMRECDVSLKQGSRFNHWVTGQNDYYYHPFSLPLGYSDLNLVPFWQTVRDQVSFTDAVSQQGKLSERALAPKQISTPEFAFNVNYGYHLDAGKFAEFLRMHCVEKLGVRHISDHVERITSDESGDISTVVTSNNGAIEGHLFIDCTGFNGLLIDQHFQVPMIDVKWALFNDRALAMHVPYDQDSDPIASMTLSTAQSSGWVWDIGLPSRRGVGHVYSSDFISDDKAEFEMRRYVESIIGKEKSSELAVRKIHFSPGYRKQFWYRNCVAVGLSAGFVEPLEASALVLVELAASMITEQLPTNRHIMNLTAKRFNEKFNYRWHRIIEFLKLHYVLNQRHEDYWQAHRHDETIPDSLKESLELWRHRAPWYLDTPYIDEMFPSASYQFVLCGMGFITESEVHRSRDDDASSAKANQLFSQNAKRTAQLLESMPTNRELTNKIKAFGFQKI